MGLAALEIALETDRGCRQRIAVAERGGGFASAMERVVRSQRSLLGDQESPKRTAIAVLCTARLATDGAMRPDAVIRAARARGCEGWRYPGAGATWT